MDGWEWKGLMKDCVDNKYLMNLRLQWNDGDIIFKCDHTAFVRCAQLQCSYDERIYGNWKDNLVRINPINEWMNERMNEGMIG